MTILKAVNLGAAFLLELAMLAALAYGGFQAGSSPILRWGLGMGAPLLVAVIWGLLMAPRAERKLTGASYLLLKGVLFGTAAIALFATGQTALALVFVAAAVINQVLLLVWKQETPTH